MNGKFAFAIGLAFLALGVLAAPDGTSTSTAMRGLMNRSALNRSARSTSRGPQVAPTSSVGRDDAAADSAADGEGKKHSFNWTQTESEIVLQAYAAEVGKTLLIDPQTPKAQITLKSEEGRILTREEYLEAIEVVLEMNQIHIEPYGEAFIKALPRKSVRNEGIPLIMDSTKKLDESGKVVSMMIKFENISAKEEAQAALEGFKSSSGILLVFERTNSILVTDTQQNINRMLEIAHAIDIPTPVLENVFVRQIKYAAATDVKEFLEKIVEDSMKLMEKSGKGQQNVQNQQRSQPNTPGGRLLGRNPAPQAPESNLSKVMSVSDADRGMIRGNVLILADERSNKLVIKSQKSNMDFFDRVIEQIDIETTPDTAVKVYRLKYANAEEVSDMINDLIGNAPSGKSGSKGSQNQNSKQGGAGRNLTSGNNQAAQRKSVNQRSGESKTGELSKDNTTVLADKRINGLVVMTEKELVPTLEQIIESMDVKLSQVLIETVIIEVGLGDNLKTGMDWLQKGRETVQKPITGGITGYDAYGNPQYQKMYYAQQKTTITGSDGYEKTSTSFLGSLVPEGFKETETTKGDGWTKTVTKEASSLLGTTAQISHDGLANYWTAGTATAIGGGQGGRIAHEVATGITSNLLGSAFNFIFSSDELGIAGILQLSKTDSHTRYVASPIIMTLDNKEAVIEATDAKQFLTGWTANSSGYAAGSGMPSPNYTSKDIGIKIKATPKINPNGTVMLEVEEEYSQVTGSQEMMTPSGATYVNKLIDIPSTRKMESDVILENGQTVVFGGLTQTYTYEKESGIPILKDIPWIGKWLFGTVEKEEDRTELLVFMTPYVLNDSEAAQAEALRRKKTMSDPRPWEDHGWSLSALADPVSKKEQMRRLREEWKRQDEERQTKLEIEGEKLKRVKELEKMTKSERDFWIKQHKDELEEEEKEELEKKLLDKESQEELRKLADDVRARKLKEAEGKISEADAAAAADNVNEHDRLKKSDKPAADAPADEVKEAPAAEAKDTPAVDVKEAPAVEAKDTPAVVEEPKSKAE